MGQKPKRPRPAKIRTRPSDANSLMQQLRAIHAEILQAVNHLKRSPHDFQTRKRLAYLHDQRSASFHALHALNIMLTTKLTEELHLTYSGEMPSRIGEGYDRTAD